MSTIITRNSANSGSVPASLVQGELAINVTDGRLFYGSGSGNVVKEFTASGSGPSISASYALTASYVNPLTQIVQITGSLSINDGTYPILDTSNKILNDNSGNTSTDWSARQLISTDGTSIAANWSSKELLSTGNRVSIDWENRELVGSDGLTHILNWNNTASAWFSGSLYGTASWALNSITSSYVNPLHQNVILTGSLLVTQSHISTVDYIDFVTTNGYPHQEGRLHWTDDTKTLQIDTDVNDFMIEIGHQNVVRVRNITGGILTKGKIVYINGESGNRPTVVTASWDGDPTSAATLGWVAQNINDSQTGYVVTNGMLRDINTNAYPPGTQLYLSSSGDYTSTIPISPKHEVRLGKVITQATAGTIYVDVMNGYELGELHDVLITSASNGDLISWDSGSKVWKNSKSLSGSYSVSGSLTINNYLNTSTQITANIGSTTICSLPTSSYDGAWFEYTARSGSNARAGQITSIWSGSLVNFTETTTTDFGSTSGLSLGVFIIGANMALTASSSTSGWTIKTVIRSI